MESNPKKVIMNYLLERELKTRQFMKFLVAFSQQALEPLRFLLGCLEFSQGSFGQLM